MLMMCGPGARATSAPDRYAKVNGITLAYREIGPKAGRPIILVAGVNMQLVDWPEELTKGAAGRDEDDIGLRQGLAQLTLGDIRPVLPKVRAPTAVLHGSDDPLVSVKAGEEVARAIPGAK
jgi:pimeloyl-ACP methyl ester carboxylesterase